MVRYPVLRKCTVVKDDKTGGVVVFVPASELAASVSGGKTSRRQLIYLSKAVLRETGVRVSFVITQADSLLDLEAGLSVLVRKAIRNQEAHAFLFASSSGSTDIWIDGPVVVGPDQEKVAELVRQVAAEYLNNAGFVLHEVYWRGVSVPTTPMVLRAVKIVQPTTSDQVGQELDRQGFPGVPARWVRNQLDRLRRQALIQWENGLYALTAQGLSLLPVSKGGRSSDVERALALGRRKW